MSVRFLDFLSYIMIGGAIVLGIILYSQGGRVIDVGKMMQQNTEEIVKTKKEAIIAKEAAVVAKLMVDEIQKKLDNSLKQDKTTLDTVTTGREERYIAQTLYLKELNKMKCEIKDVKKDHAKRLAASEALVKEVRELRVKLKNCSKADMP